MRVATLTYHNVENYGAALQAYALQQVLFSLGADTEILNYSKKSIKPSGKERVKSILKYPLHQKTKHVFQCFRVKNMKMSKPILSQNDFINEVAAFDSVIVGSDQVWNPRLNQCDPVYFLKLPFQTKTKKYSYAASFGRYDFLDNEKELISAISDFDKISIREADAMPMIKNIASCPVYVNLDPVLLISATQWANIAVTKRALKHTPYVVLYTVGFHNRQLYHVALKAAEQLNASVVWISDSIKKISGVRAIRHCSPNEFIGLLMNAEAVVTNSFHATAYSVIFEKKYHIDLDNAGVKHNNRSANLLEMLNLPADSINKSINWHEVKTLLDAARTTSIDYLKTLCQKE